MQSALLKMQKENASAWMSMFYYTDKIAPN